MVEGAPHTAKRPKGSIVVSPWGAPSPVYKGARGRGPAKGRWRAQGGSPTPTGSRTPPFLVGVGEKERGGEGEGRGRPPP